MARRTQRSVSLMLGRPSRVLADSTDTCGSIGAAGLPTLGVPRPGFIYTLSTA